MRDLAPAHVHWLLQLLAVPGMEPLDGLAAFRKLLLHGESLQRGARLFGVPAHQHAAWCKHSRGRKPDGAASYVDELQAAVDVVVLLPESAALPCDLVGACIRTLVDHLPVRRAEVVGRLLQNGEGHGTDAIVRLDHSRRAMTRIPNLDALRSLS